MQIYLPGAGWIGFDPSWGLLAGSNYFPVAVSRHSEHVPPISGTYFGTQRAFLRAQIDLYVKRVDESLVPGLDLVEKAPDPMKCGEPISVRTNGAPGLSSLGSDNKSTLAIEPLSVQQQG